MPRLFFGRIALSSKSLFQNVKKEVSMVGLKILGRNLFDETMNTFPCPSFQKSKRNPCKNT